MILPQSAFRTAITIALLAIAVRLLLFFTVQGGLRNGQAGYYGSVAVGLQQGKGLTFDQGEIDRIQDMPNNYTGDYLRLAAEGPRVVFTEYLPGPAVLLNLLWRVTGIHTFAPLVFFQILLDSVLIGVLYMVLAGYHRGMALLVCTLLAINLASIKRTLMVGYDFWPQVEVLVVFFAALAFIERRRGPLVLWVAGIVGAIIPWFRDLTSFLPFMVAGALLLVFTRRAGRKGFQYALWGSTALLVPVLVSLLLMSVFRYETTGNFRPTRSTFWHTVMCGVGQFSNPYGIWNNDQSVWELGKTLNPSLAASKLDDMYRLPDSPYEMTLKAKATEFVREHPVLFLRNFVYRVGVMISPLLYKDGDFIPSSVAGWLYPFGLCMLPLWFLGMIAMYRRYRAVFIVAVSIYAYFFLAFGWFYVAGRIISSFLFLSLFVYLLGAQSVWLRLRARRTPEPAESLELR